MPASFVRSVLAVLLVALAACSDSSSPDESTRVRYASVSAGYAHTCALSRDGRLYCWGDSWPSFTNSVVPAELQLPEPLAGISSAASTFGGSVCGWTSMGVVYCWGGWTRINDVMYPYGNGVDPVQIPGSGPLQGLANATAHGCGLQVDSTAACWGSFVFGRRGLLQPNDTVYATLTASQIVSDLKFSRLATNFSSSCGILLDGQVACWGDSTMLANSSGAYLTGGNPCFFASLACRVAPSAIPGVSGATALASGGDLTCAVASQGVRCWGPGITGVQSISLPINPVSLGVGSGFACGMDAAGRVYCWGDIDFEALTPTADDVPPTEFAVRGHHFVQLSVGSLHACGILDDGSMYCWGGTAAALGNGKGQSSNVPVRVAEPKD